MMPQNQRLGAEAPLAWGIYRNMPFALLGLLVIVLFYRSAKDSGDKAFRWMWLTIVMSFGFYIPVVLWADTIPLMGMLMIPKTCAYVCADILYWRSYYMDKYIFDESNGLWYELQEGLLYPLPYFTNRKRIQKGF